MTDAFRMTQRRTPATLEDSLQELNADVVQIIARSLKAEAAACGASCAGEPCLGGGGWCPERDGGCLRVEVGDCEAVDVAPLGGRLVIFSSKHRWHEVLPSRRDQRFALTLWVHAEARREAAPPARSQRAARALVARAADERGRTSYRWIESRA